MEHRVDPPPDPAPGDPTAPVDGTLRSAYRFVAGAGVAIAALTAALAGGRAAAGAAIGAAIATANLWIFAQIVHAFLDRREISAPWAIIAVLKLVGLLGVVYVIVRAGVSPATLGIGYAALPFGIVFAGLFGAKPA